MRGIESIQAPTTGVIALVAPGPVVTTETPKPGVVENRYARRTQQRWLKPVHAGKSLSDTILTSKSIVKVHRSTARKQRRVANLGWQGMKLYSQILS